MPSGIYINPTSFVSFDEMAVNRGALSKAIASRDAAFDFSEITGLLPDPDPVLRKRGDGVEILEQLTADAHLMSVVQSRKLGVLRQEFKFEPGVAKEGEKPSSQAEQLAADFSADLKAIGMRDLLSSILDAPYYGMTPIELTFAPTEGRLKLAKAEGKPVRWFGFDADNNPRFKSLEKEEEGEELPWGKFVFVRHFPTYDNPYGLRLFSRCFWPITFKKGGLKFWVTFMEKYGMPFLLGRYSRGTTPDQQQQMLNNLQQMVRDAVAVVPEGDSVELLGGKSAGGHMVFEKMKTAMNEEISKVIQGQTLTTESGSSGSYSLGKVHGEVLTAFQESDLTMAKEALNEIAGIYAKVNADGVPAPVCTFFESEDPQKDFADRDRVLEAGGRVRFSKSYYIRRYGYQDDDFEIVEPAAAGQMGGGVSQGFAEEKEKVTGPCPEEVSALAAQDALDKKIAAASKHGAGIFSELKKRLNNWLAEKDIETAVTSINSLLGNLQINDFRQFLEEQLLDSASLGTLSASDNKNFAEEIFFKNKAFRGQVDFFKAKAFTIAGDVESDVVALVKDELVRQMEEGGTMDEFCKNFNTIWKKRGLDPLNPYRIDTIYRTNMQGAYMAARYAQLTTPSMLKRRPYWRYIAVRDGASRLSHEAMHGRVFHHSNAVWQIWWPPNGFNCRCTVVALSERDIARYGYTVEEEAPMQETIIPETGEIIKESVLPDSGWGEVTHSLEKQLNTQRETSGGTLTWREKKDQPKPKELGRPTKGEIPAKQWKTLARGVSLKEIMDTGVSEEKALLQIENIYKETMGIAPQESQAVLRGRDGATLLVTLQSLSHAMYKRDDARERFIPHLRATIEDPYEVLLTEYETQTGKTKYRRKYIGLFTGEKDEAVIIVAELLPSGAVLWNIMNTRRKSMDRQRKGVKVLYARDAKKEGEKEQ